MVSTDSLYVLFTKFTNLSSSFVNIYSVCFVKSSVMTLKTISSSKSINSLKLINNFSRVRENHDTLYIPKMHDFLVMDNMYSYKYDFQ